MIACIQMDGVTKTDEFTEILKNVETIDIKNGVSY